VVTDHYTTTEAHPVALFCKFCPTVLELILITPIHNLIHRHHSKKTSCTRWYVKHVKCPKMVWYMLNAFHKFFFSLNRLHFVVIQWDTIYDCLHKFTPVFGVLSFGHKANRPNPLHINICFSIMHYYFPVIVSYWPSPVAVLPEPLLLTVVFFSICKKVKNSKSEYVRFIHASP